MALQIPSLLELAQSAITPKFLKNIDSEHQIVKTARNTEELVSINKGLVSSQVQLATQWLDNTSKMELAWRNTDSRLAGLHDDLLGIQKTIEDFSVTAIRGLERINNNVLRGFNLIGEGLGKIIGLHVEEIRVLDHISVVLSNPYETQVRELRQSADEIFQNSLRRANENQTKNLQTCLDIYKHIVVDIRGQLDYLVWFQIGWLNWKLLEDPAEAKEAFDEAQRLSDAVDSDEARSVRAKSLRHLARMHFLLSDFEQARISIERALSINGNDAHTLHDAALYCALCGRDNDAQRSFSSALQHEPLLYISTHVDRDFAQLNITKELLDDELHIRLSLVSRLLHKMDYFYAEILPIWNQLDGEDHSIIQRFISVRSTAHQNAATAGYITLRQMAPDMANILQEALAAARDLLYKRIAEEEKVFQQLEQHRASALEYESRETRREKWKYEIDYKYVIHEAGVNAMHPDKFAIEWFGNSYGCLTWPALIVAFIFIGRAMREKVDNVWALLFYSALITGGGAFLIEKAVWQVYYCWYKMTEIIRSFPLPKKLETLRLEHNREIERIKREAPIKLAAAEARHKKHKESLQVFMEWQQKIDKLEGSASV